MAQGQVVPLLFLLFLLLLSAFFSAAETALFSVNKVKLRHLAEKGNRQALLTKRLLEKPSQPLSAILIGNNVVNIGATALATMLALELFGNSGAGIATLVMSLLILVLGEITPKTLASQRAEAFSLKVSPYVYGLGRILAPLIALFNFFTNFLLKLMGSSQGEAQLITEEELRMLVNVGEEEGFIDQAEREMIDSIFEFDDTLVREVMVPRIDIDAIDLEESLQNTIKLVLKAGHSRIPVYEQSVDNIVGLIYAKDLLQVFFAPHKEKIALKEIMRPAYYVPEGKKVRDLFAELRKGKVHMAIVLDEYGGTAGLVTIEDVIEEIVGDIQDEYDREEKTLEKLSDGSWLVDARASIYEINEKLAVGLPSADFETITGFVFHHLGKLPTAGQVIFINDWQIKVEKIVGRRIVKLRLQKSD